MTILAYIGNKILENDKINSLTGEEDARRDAFVTNFYMLYTHRNIHKNVKMILKNCFISPGTRVLILHLYSRIKRVYNGLIKLGRIFKWKRARLSSVETDLFMNSLNNYPACQKIDLLQNNTIYNFRITDILNIWNTALCHSASFSPIPCLPKNPYTNIPFDLGHLAACYIKSKKLDFNIPLPIIQFWEASMDLDKFILEAYPLLKEYVVMNHIADSCDETLFYDIVHMVSSLSKHLNERTISMDLRASVKEKFIADMKPFLKNYLLSQHTCNPLKKRSKRKAAITGLKAYFVDNPLAGRRIVYPAMRRARRGRRNFSLVSDNILDDSIFIFGAAAPDATPNDSAAGEATENESYNEVLDDSDDETLMSSLDNVPENQTTEDLTVVGHSINNTLTDNESDGSDSEELQ